MKHLQGIVVDIGLDMLNQIHGLLAEHFVSNITQSDTAGKPHKAGSAGNSPLLLTAPKHLTAKDLLPLIPVTTFGCH